MLELLLEESLSRRRSAQACERGARIGAGAADDHQRHPRPVEDRSGQARSRAGVDRPARASWRRSSACCGRWPPTKGLQLESTLRRRRAGARARRRRPAAPGADEPGRQCRQVHRRRAACRSRITRHAARGERVRPAVHRSRTPASASPPTRFRSSSRSSRSSNGAADAARQAAPGSACRSAARLIELMGGTHPGDQRAGIAAPCVRHRVGARTAPERDAARRPAPAAASDDVSPGARRHVSCWSRTTR